MSSGPEESAGAKLTSRVLGELGRLAGRPKSKDGVSPLVQILTIVIPVVASVFLSAWGATTVTTNRLREAAAVTAEKLEATADKLEAMSELLHELRGGQKDNSDEVIRLRGEVEDLVEDLERLRQESVTGDRLAVETVERENVEKRWADLYAAMSLIVAKNTSRVETLRSKHNLSKE